MTERYVARAVVARRRNQWGEFVVKAYDQDGAHYPAADYHTDDLQDAISTADAMMLNAGKVPAAVPTPAGWDYVD